MSLLWPKDEKLKQFINRVVRKLKRDKLTKTFEKVNVAGIVKQLDFDGSLARMYLPSEDTGLSRQLHFSSIREWRSTRYLIDLLNRKQYDNIIDLGANLGYFVLIESIFSKAKIIAIEPVKFNYEILKLNMSLNQLNEIDIRNIAIGNSDKDVTIYEFGQKNWSTVDVSHAELLESQGYKSTKQQVKQITLDALLEEFNSNCNSGLIRMDVEGFEYEILSSSSLLKNNSYDLFVEFHSNILGKAKSVELLNFLKNSGYSNVVIIFNEEFSLDEQIFKYNNKNRLQKIKLDHLIKEISSSTENFIKSNHGFEMFLSKGEL
jgi:FkbM family methyltransferase